MSNTYFERVPHTPANNWNPCSTTCPCLEFPFDDELDYVSEPCEVEMPEGDVVRARYVSIENAWVIMDGGRDDYRIYPTYWRYQEP